MSSDPYVLKLFWWFSYVLKLFGWFSYVLKRKLAADRRAENFEHFGDVFRGEFLQKQQSFQNFRLRRHNMKQRISCYVHKSAFPIPSHCVHSYSSLMYIRAGFLSHLHTVHHTYCRVLHVCTQASYSVRSYSRVLLLCT